MRVVRSILGVLLALLGLIIGAAGGVAAFWLVGPDDTVYSGEQHLTSKGLAIASVRPCWIGMVRSCTSRPARPRRQAGLRRRRPRLRCRQLPQGLRATRSWCRCEYPIALTTQDKKGAAGPLAAPDTLDWWVAKANGAGTQ